MFVLLNKLIYRNDRYIDTSDIFNLNQGQKKILQGIIHFEKNDKKIGCTQYDLDRKLPKANRVAGSTFSENIGELEKRQLVESIQLKKHVWKKKNHRPAYPYSITPLGIIAYLKSLQPSKVFRNVQDLITKIPYIAEHWYELESLGNEFSDKLKNLYFEFLSIAFVQSLNQLQLKHLIPNSDQNFNRTIEEKTSFRSTKSEIALIRLYQNYSKKEIEGLKKIQTKMKKGYKILPLVLPNYNDLPFNVIERFAFLFYYNVISIIDNPGSIFSVYTEADFNTKLSNWMNLKEAFLKKQIVPKIMLLILKDKQLAKILEQNMSEINNVYEKPRIFQLMTNVLNDKKLR